jgi:hypothetical protein
MIFKKLMLCMSQAGSAGGGGGGGGSNITINGNTGSSVGTVFDFVGTDMESGGTVRFDSAAGTITLDMTDANQNVGVGQNALANVSSGVQNCAFGLNACVQNTTGLANTAFGTNTLSNNTATDFNTAVGGGALNTLAGGSGDNTAAGRQSLNQLLDGSYNTCYGRFSGFNYTSSESSNICIAAGGTTGESNAIRIGSQGGGLGQQNTCYVAGIAGVVTANSEMVTVDTTTGQLGSATIPSGGVTINGDTGSATGNPITFDGLTNAGATVSFSATGSTVSLNTTDSVGDRNTLIGLSAGNGTFTAQNNTSVGAFTLNSVTTGGQNVAVGANVLQMVDTGDYNTAIGYNAGQMMTSALQNTLIGGVAGSSITTGNQNTAVGYGALTVSTTSAFNSAFGNGAMASLSGGANGSNVAVGFGALNSLIDGRYNIAIGRQSGNAYAGTEISNICISNSGVVSESNTIRLGTTGTGQGEQSRAFIAGSYGVTTDSLTTSPLLISDEGQLGTISSSARYKDNIQDMDDTFVMKLRPVNFSYKTDTSKRKQYGLIAEEVYAIMPEIVNLDEEGRPDNVRYHDMPAILLHEIQKLRKELDELKGKLA